MTVRTSYLALLGLVLFASGCDSSEPDVATAQVTYRVSAFGDYPAARAATVEWTDGEGDTQTTTDVALPWSRTVSVESGRSVRLRATAQSAAGAVGLRVAIEADGQTIGEDTAAGTASPIGTVTADLSIMRTVTVAAD